MQEAFLPAEQLLASARAFPQRFQPVGQPASQGRLPAGSLQVRRPSHLVGCQQAEHVRQRPIAHPRRLLLPQSSPVPPSSPARAVAVARRSRLAAACRPIRHPAAPPFRPTRPSARCAAGQSFARSRMAARASSAAAVCSRRAAASACFVSPRRASAAASSRLRRSISSGGRSGRIRGRQGGERTVGVALSLPHRCQPRPESGAAGTGRRRLHQLLQHRPRPLRQIQRQQTIGQARFQRFAVRSVRQQIGVLVDQRDQFQRRQPSAAVAAQERGEHVRQLGRAGRSFHPGTAIRSRAACASAARHAPDCAAQAASRSRSCQLALIAAPGINQPSSLTAACLASIAPLASRTSTACTGGTRMQGSGRGDCASRS